MSLINNFTLNPGTVFVPKLLPMDTFSPCSMSKPWLSEFQTSSFFNRGDVIAFQTVQGSQSLLTVPTRHMSSQTFKGKLLSCWQEVSPREVLPRNSLSLLDSRLENTVQSPESVFDFLKDESNLPSAKLKVCRDYLTQQFPLLKLDQQEKVLMGLYQALKGVHVIESNEEELREQTFLLIDIVRSFVPSKNYAETIEMLQGIYELSKQHQDLLFKAYVLRHLVSFYMGFYPQKGEALVKELAEEVAQCSDPEAGNTLISYFINACRFAPVSQVIKLYPQISASLEQIAEDHIGLEEALIQISELGISLAKSQSYQAETYQLLTDILACEAKLHHADAQLILLSGVAEACQYLAPAYVVPLLEQVVVAARELDATGADGLIFKQLIVAASFHSQQAENLFEEAYSRAMRLEDVAMQIDLLIKIARAYHPVDEVRAARTLRQARGLFQNFAPYHVTPFKVEQWIHLGEAYATIGQQDPVMILLEALSMIGQVDSVQERAQLLRRLADTCQYLRFEEADDILSRACKQAEAIIPDVVMRETLVSEIMRVNEHQNFLRLNQSIETFGDWSAPLVRESLSHLVGEAGADPDLLDVIAMVPGGKLLLEARGLQRVVH